MTRRALLSLLGSTIATLATPDRIGAEQKSAAAKQLPSVGEFVRFSDDLTETLVVRLTSLDSASFLPARENRAISVKGRFLLFSSDRAGALSPFRLDLRTGQVLPLLSTANLDRRSLSMDAAGRVLFFLEGRNLKQISLTGKKVQIVAENVSQFSLGASAQDLVFIRDGKMVRAGIRETVLAEGALWCQIQPGDNGCLFSRESVAGGEDLWFVAFANASAPMRLAEGPLSDPCWSPDGRSVLFLREGAICEIVLDARTERRIGGVSKFVTFSANNDSSVFVGAIRSKAQPTVNLLLRNPPREFTLCQHKASHPEDCVPVFSADSRRVYFNSDFQGKPAIYSVNVEQLIEETSG